MKPMFGGNNRERLWIQECGGPVSGTDVPEVAARWLNAAWETTIIGSRYADGWLAFPAEYDVVARAMSNDGVFPSAVINGGDNEHFAALAAFWYGQGATPDEALADLLAKAKELAADVVEGGGA